VRFSHCLPQYTYHFFVKSKSDGCSPVVLVVVVGYWAARNWGHQFAPYLSCYHTKCVLALLSRCTCAVSSRCPVCSCLLVCHPHCTSLLSTTLVTPYQPIQNQEFIWATCQSTRWHRSDDWATKFNKICRFFCPVNCRPVVVSPRHHTLKIRIPADAVVEQTTFIAAVTKPCYYSCKGVICFGAGVLGCWRTLCWLGVRHLPATRSRKRCSTSRKWTSTFPTTFSSRFQPMPLTSFVNFWRKTQSLSTHHHIGFMLTSR